MQRARELLCFWPSASNRRRPLPIYGVLALLVGLPVAAGADEVVRICRVLDPELAGYYQGSCDDEGLATGVGIAQGFAQYVGEFKAGKKHGFGVKQWPSGSRYVGQFADDERQGKGVYEWQEPSWRGERYLGDYLADKRHGQGVYLWPNGDRYRGEWANDLLVGTPTALMQRRAAHQEALAKSVKQVGVKVCREQALGIVKRERVSGTVDSIDGDSLVIKLIDAGSGVTDQTDGKGKQIGELVRDSAKHWVPCYE